MAFDKHKTRGKKISEDDQTEEKKMIKKKPFEEGSRTDKGKNLDGYDKEQKDDKELAEKDTRQ
jgi:hypothetical protein